MLGNTVKENQNIYLLIAVWIFISLFMVSDSLAQKSNNGNFICRWLVIGPFIEGKPAPEAIKEDYLLSATGRSESEYATVQDAPQAGEGVVLTPEGYATQTRIWKLLRFSENGDVNNMLVEEGEVDFAVAYLCTFIDSRENTRRKLMIGSDDSVKVWLNGKVVYEAAVERPLTPDEDRVWLNLKSGMNCLMVKVADSRREWGITVRFADDSGLRYFDTPNRQLLSFGKKIVRLPNLEAEAKKGIGKEGFWQTYRYVDGLADNDVQAIIQDERGFIWLGTMKGVSRFDGENWITYNEDDGLASNSVRAIMQDSEGNIWLGTQEGITVIKPESYFSIVKNEKNWKTYTEEDGLASNSVHAIMQDSDGNIWFATGDGVSRFDGESWKNYKKDDGLVSNRVHAIMQDSEGNIWFGTMGGGVSRFDGENWIRYVQKDGLRHNVVFDIMQDNKGNIWFATGSGISRFDGKNWKDYPQEGKISIAPVNAIIQDKYGNIWAGGIPGVIRFDGKDWKRYSQRDGLTDNKVNAIIQDREGAIWFATASGVSRFDERTWKTFTKQGLENGPVNAILQDRRGTMWFATQRGIELFDGKNWRTYDTIRNRLANSPTYDIIQDRKGRIWMGTWRGVKRIYEDNLVIYIQRDGLAHNWVHTLLEDNQSTMWFGTRGGVSHFDGKNWTNYTKEDGLGHNVVFDIIQDSDGTFWFGTYDGVSQFNGVNWTTYTKEDGLADNRISAVLQDSQGKLWFGTSGGITSTSDDKQWKTYTKKDGLASNEISAIMEHRDGTLWFATIGGGVSHFDGRCFQTLDSRDGLANDSVYCIYEDNSGYVWFGTNGGVVRFISNKTPPSIYITEMVANDKTYTDLQKTVHFDKTVRNLTLSYHAISFKTRPSEMKYFYQLVGHDNDWQGPTNKETVEYSNLQPREYTFQVQAVDRDLNYSETASVLFIIPAPPFYQKSVFPIVLSTIGGLSLFGIVVLAVKQLRLSRQEKMRLQRELEDARQMQLRLLPEKPPTVEGFDIAGTSYPAREVGGDFFDYIMVKDGKVGIALADVSGKGLKGAMNAVLTNGMLNTVAKVEASSGRILSTLNADLYPRMERRMFTALGLSILDRDRKLRWANAAQPYPVVKRSEQVFELDSDGGIPLGVMRDSVYQEREFELQTGDIVIFYTDGISEATNEYEEIYGDERLKQALKRVSSKMNAEEIVKFILQDVANFVGNARQYDDMTVVAIKRKP